MDIKNLPALFQFIWVQIALLLTISWLSNRLLCLYLRKVISTLLNRYGIDFEKKEALRFLRPLGACIIFVVWTLGIPFLSLTPEKTKLLSHLISIGYTVTFVVFIYNLLDMIFSYLEKMAKKTRNSFDNLLISLSRKAAKCLVVTFGLLFIGDKLAVDTKNLLAGLGIGGIAFALAAKDTLSNLFGSFTILLDRPFKIGDWVVIGKETEGTVEDVGLRSTRIRTFYDSLITIPNGQLSNVNIDNYGNRKYRRMRTTLSIQYDTPPEKIEAFCESVRQLVLTHPHTRKDYFHVYLNNLSDSSLDILLYVFWEVPDWSTELTERHRLLIDILRMAQELKVEFAFPTQTLHVFPEKSVKPGSLHGKIHQKGKETAKRIAQTPITPKKHRSGTLKEDFDDEGLSI